MAIKRKFQAKRKFVKKRALKRATTKKYTALKSVIKKTILSTAETKHVPYMINKTELYHNTYTNLGNLFALCYPAQGVGDQARVGDSIQQRGVLVRMLIGQKFDRPNVTFKIWVLAVRPGTAFTTSTIFDLTTGNILLDPVNSDCCKCIYAKILKRNYQNHVSNGTTASQLTKEITYPFSFYIRRPKEIKFQTDGGVAQSFDLQYHLVIAPYDAFGSLITDNIGYVQTYLKYYFKDP